MILPQPFLVAIETVLDEFPLKPDDRELILSAAQEELSFENPAITIHCNGTSITIRGLSPTLSTVERENTRKAAA
jgi:hypothetical protein